MRTHVDVTDPKLTALKAMVEVRDEVRDLVDLQIVAFPQEGIESYANGRALMTEAVAMGADVVGGIPHFENTATKAWRRSSSSWTWRAHRLPGGRALR